MRSVYLDNNATTKLDPRVLEAMMPFLRDHYGNPSSIHGFGQASRRGMDEARETIAGILGCRPNEIVFVSGGTESNNLGVLGAAEAAGERGRHIVTTTIEHKCVLRSMKILEKRGFEVTYVPVGRSGVVKAQDVTAAFREDTVLVSVMHANNETGAIQPLEKIAAEARAREILVHSDAVQTAGKVPLNVDALGVDLLSVSAHKIYGPKGAGFLYVRETAGLAPLIVGGPQERNRRAGTPNIPAIVGLGEAFKLATQRMEEDRPRIASLRDALREGIERRVAGVYFTIAPEASVYNTLHVCVPLLESEAILMNLDLAGVGASSGSACTSGSIEPSHVLEAMGLPTEISLGAVRLSLGRATSAEDVEYTAGALADTVDRLRELSPEWEPFRERGLDAEGLAQGLVRAAG